jgi:hypothetical protein
VLEVVDDVVELVELDDVLLDVVVVGGDVLLELVVVDDELEELEDELLLDELEVVGGIVLIIHHPSMSCLSSLVPRYWSWLLLC